MNSNIDLTISANFDQYVHIRNNHAIGNYVIEKKHKYMKKIITKEYVIDCIKTKAWDWVAYDDYWMSNLMSHKNFKYVDEYLTIIPRVCEKTPKVNKDYELYYDVWKLGSKYVPGDTDFCHNGCFYLAMIFLGYEPTILPYGYMGFHCKIKSNITLL
jgi:hypothetical protein